MGYYIGQFLALILIVYISRYLERRIRSLWKKSSSKTNSKQRQEDMTRVRTGDLIIILLLLCTVVLLISFVMYLAGF